MHDDNDETKTEWWTESQIGDAIHRSPQEVAELLRQPGPGPPSKSGVGVDVGEAVAEKKDRAVATRSPGPPPRFYALDLHPLFRVDEGT